ncbi:MAG: ABC transporter permease [Anaerolineae bacterium]|jgi:ABC-2 type transport system permease protein
MSKVWLVAEQQFKKDVLKRSFLLAILAMPLFLGFIAGMGWLSVRLQQKTITVGYADPGNALGQMPSTLSDQVRLARYDTAAAARAALDAGQIDAYYALPADYPQSRQTELVFAHEIDGQAAWAFQQAVRRNLLAGEPEAVVERALAGPTMAVHATALNKTLPLGAPGLGEFLPLMAAVLFAFLIMSVASTLMVAVVAEKENRTIEIVVSSISPGQMMAGKVLGVMGMALLLAASWVALLLIFAWFGANVMQWDWLREVSIDGRNLALLMVVALPSFMFMAALMVALGATVVEAQEAQQIGGVAFMIVFIPIYLFFLFGNNPDGPLAIAFSLFPMTSVATLAVRSIFMEVPTAQFLAAALVALLSALAMIWLAGKLFRANMLRYGQGLRLRQLWRGRRARVEELA